MALSVIQTACCVLLIVAALSYWVRSQSNKNVTRGRALLPFVLAAGISGIAYLAPLPWAFFKARLEGADYTAEAYYYRLTGPYWWVYGLAAILVLLPLLGLIPAVGKRFLLVATLGLLALIPVWFEHIVLLITSAARW